jgi:hypothetical protein
MPRRETICYVVLDFPPGLRPVDPVILDRVRVLIDILAAAEPLQTSSASLP